MEIPAFLLVDSRSDAVHYINNSLSQICNEGSTERRRIIESALNAANLAKFEDKLCKAWVYLLEAADCQGHFDAETLAKAVDILMTANRYEDAIAVAAQMHQLDGKSHDRISKQQAEAYFRLGYKEVAGELLKRSLSSEEVQLHFDKWASGHASIRLLDSKDLLSTLDSFYRPCKTIMEHLYDLTHIQLHHQQFGDDSFQASIAPRRNAYLKMQMDNEILNNFLATARFEQLTLVEMSFLEKYLWLWEILLKGRMHDSLDGKRWYRRFMLNFSLSLASDASFSLVARAPAGYYEQLMKHWLHFASDYVEGELSSNFQFQPFDDFKWFSKVFKLFYLDRWSRIEAYENFKTPAALICHAMFNALKAPKIQQRVLQSATVVESLKDLIEIGAVNFADWKSSLLSTSSSTEQPATDKSFLENFLFLMDQILGEPKLLPKDPLIFVHFVTRCDFLASNLALLNTAGRQHLSMTLQCLWKSFEISLKIDKTTLKMLADDSAIKPKMIRSLAQIIGASGDGSLLGNAIKICSVLCLISNDFLRDQTFACGGSVALATNLAKLETWNAEAVRMLLLLFRAMSAEEKERNLERQPQLLKTIIGKLCKLMAPEASTELGTLVYLALTAILRSIGTQLDVTVFMGKVDVERLLLKLFEAIRYPTASQIAKDVKNQKKTQFAIESLINSLAAGVLTSQLCAASFKPAFLKSLKSRRQSALIEFRAKLRFVSNL